MPAIFKGSTVKRTRELEAAGISRVQLQAVVKAGQAVRVGRGLYRLPEAEVSENHSLALAAKRAPQGVVCLLSALRFHGLTTQSPNEIWLALPKHSWQPQAGGLPLRFFWFSGEALSEGIKTHHIEGVPVRVYSPAKTVADCFKYRGKIGLDVALEALRETWRERRCTMDELMRYARICRVANVIRPYLEALT
jgi:predicted transcriptional regulator of viral defense system